MCCGGSMPRNIACSNSRGIVIPSPIVKLRSAEEYAESALAPATRKAYETDWRIFAGWCAARGLPAIPAPPATVAAFLAAVAVVLS